MLGFLEDVIVFHICILNISHKILIMFEVASLNLSLPPQFYSISGENVFHCTSFATYSWSLEETSPKI